MRICLVEPRPHMKSWMLRKAASQLTKSTHFNLILSLPSTIVSVWVAQAA